MSIKEIKSGTLYKEYALEIPYEEINKVIDSWRSSHIWKYEGSNWYLRNPIWHENN